MPQLTDQHIAGVMQAYVDAISAGDIDAILNLFAPDAIVEDPVDSTPQQGHSALRDFYQMAVDSVARMQLEGNVRARGNRGACAMLAYPRGAEDAMVIETLDVMTFNNDGKITAMTAYWGDANIREVT